MYGMLVLFEPADGLGDLATLRNKFYERVRLYEHVEGLGLKAWLIDEEGGRQGGFYIWESREALEAFMRTEQWKSLPAFNRADPEVAIFEMPALMNALGGQAIAATAAHDTVPQVL